MFCPDCGTESLPTDHFCASCGYPLEALRKCLQSEKDNSVGWAENIIGKSPEMDDVLIADETLETFTDIPDQAEKIKTPEGFQKCERCGATVEISVIVRRPSPKSRSR